MATDKTYYVQMKQEVKNADGTTSSHSIKPITEGGAVDVYVGEVQQTLQDVVDNLSDFAFKDTVPSASTTSSGVVQLSDDTNSEDSTLAATSKALSEVNKSAIHNSGDETIAGVKTFSDGVGLSGATLTSTYDEVSDTRTVKISFI